MGNKAGLTLTFVHSRQGSQDKSPFVPLYKRGSESWEGGYFLMNRYRISRRMAPPVASRMLPRLNPVTVPNPRKDPT